MNTRIVPAVLMVVAIGNNLLAVEPAEQTRIEPIIDMVRSNEAGVLHCVVEGAYERQEFSPAGVKMGSVTYSPIRFSRSGDLIKVERAARSEVVQGMDSEMAEYHETLFYSPDSTTYVYANDTLARREPPEEPFPFPLGYGYGLRYRPEKKARITSVTPAWERHAHSGALTARVDPDNPDLILLDTFLEPTRIRQWIDPKRGGLIVKSIGETILPKPWNRTLPLEEISVVPKQYGNVWYVESATRKMYREHGDNPASMKTYLMSVETWTVTHFEFRARIEEGNLSFDLKKFPNLKLVFDRLKQEKLDLKTGKRSAWRTGSTSDEDGK